MGGAIGGIAQGVGSYGAGKWAAGATKKAAGIAQETQMAMFHQARGDLMPWMKIGKGALEQLEALTAEGPGDFVPSEDPGYKFGF